MGSLTAAVASYLRARQSDGEWLLRVEDIDPPREVKGASASFLTTLEAFGLEWDGEVTYQSQRIDLYRDALESLRKLNTVYRCRCSRRDIRAAIAVSHSPQNVYPGTCLNHPPDETDEVNWRLKTNNACVRFTDMLQGDQIIRFGVDQGDFVVWRKNDFPSYQLAVTVDDLDQGVTEVVRGIDLLHETAGQILLRNAFTPDTPDWVHIPTVVNQHGHKLSKQTAAPALDTSRAAQQLCDALSGLGLPVDSALKRAAVRDIWSYAIERWKPNKLFQKKKITLD